MAYHYYSQQKITHFIIDIFDCLNTHTVEERIDNRINAWGQISSFGCAFGRHNVPITMS